ncbi:MAG TPA: serine/threonine-protein kinase [Paludibacter sp.]
MFIGLHTASLNFETIKEIGQEGKNSTVFIAHDKQLDGEIVVKKIEKSKMPNAAEYFNESKLLYNSIHQNIVRVIYGCEDNDHIYIAMPYYKNGSIKSLINKRYLTVREIIRYSIQFLAGLNHIHTKGLIHFDVKPDNILLSDTNEALLSDFGLVAAMDHLGFAEQLYAYNKQLPPERFSQNKFAIQYDIYLAGLTIYRLCNGNENFYNQMNFSCPDEYKEAILKGHFPDRNFYLPHIPKKLRKSINKALNVDPSLRHNNILELINEIGAIDCNLDLKFTTTIGIDSWELNLPNKVYIVEVIKKTSNFDILTSKTMIDSGKRTKVIDYCCTGVTGAIVLRKLDKIFKDLA